MDEINKSTKEIVKMSNKLAEAKYRLSLQSQKIYLYAVSQINEDVEDFNVIKFRLIDFAKKSNSDITRLYKDIDSITDELMRTFFKVEIGENIWEKYTLMNRCKYDNGELTIKFDFDMKLYLLNLKEKYSKHLLDKTIQFNSKYSIRIYQILKANQYRLHYHNIKYIEFDLSNLKEMLGLDKNQYSSFKDFRINVLEKAQDEINEKSDIRFTYDKITKGRKVVGLKITIESEIEDLELCGLYSNEQIRNVKIKSGLNKEKFNAKQIIELYEISVKKTESADISPYDYIKLNYEFMIEKGTARKKFAYLKKAIENDYASAAARLTLGYAL